MSVGLERTLELLLSARRAPPGISGPWRQMAEFACRPGKRLRPALLEIGWRAAAQRKPASGRPASPRGVQRFGAGLELLHAFFLVHDDIADAADTRRGGPALHRVLGEGKLGENLATVAGDLLFVEATDAMLSCGLRGAARAVREVLAVCRHTAAGQYLDLAFSEADLRDVAPAAAKRAEHLKTARYSFEAPLTAGALLAEGKPELVKALRKVARPLGLAFQLQDDLLPFRVGDQAGKPALADLVGGKKTWLMTLAFQALDELGRARLRRCLREADEEAFWEMERLVRGCGALAQVEREVEKLCGASRRAAKSPWLEEVQQELCCAIEKVATPSVVAAGRLLERDRRGAGAP